jgi:hypothetical protein
VTPMESFEFIKTFYKHVAPAEPFILLPNVFNSLGSTLFIENPKPPVLAPMEPPFYAPALSDHRHKTQPA